MGSTFEVISEIKILENADYANDDQTIWKDWDCSNNNEDASEDSTEGHIGTAIAMTVTDNSISSAATATNISVSNKAVGTEVVETGNASMSMTPSDTTTNNNLGTTGQFYSAPEYIQACKSTKSEDHIAKATGNTDIYSTTRNIESHDKLENITVSNVNIADSKLTSNLVPIRTNTRIQNDHVYSPTEQKVVPLSQIKSIKQETQIVENVKEEKVHVAHATQDISEPKTKIQDLRAACNSLYILLYL